jgi:hypothetical protein
MHSSHIVGTVLVALPGLVLAAISTSPAPPQRRQ